MKHFPEQPVLARQRAEALLLTQEFAAAAALWRKAGPAGSPRTMAALVLCELLAGECHREIVPGDEALVSKELLKWYRRMIAVGAHTGANQLHGRMETARLIVPTFVGAWEAATARVRETMAVA